jgi:hypothetical protein
MLASSHYVCDTGMFHCFFEAVKLFKKFQQKSELLKMFFFIQKY